MYSTGLGSSGADATLVVASTTKSRTGKSRSDLFNELKVMGELLPSGLSQRFEGLVCARNSMRIPHNVNPSKAGRKSDVQ